MGNAIMLSSSKSAIVAQGFFVPELGIVKDTLPGYTRYFDVNMGIDESAYNFLEIRDSAWPVTYDAPINFCAYVLYIDYTKNTLCGTGISNTSSRTGVQRAFDNSGSLAGQYQFTRKGTSLTIYGYANMPYFILDQRYNWIAYKI